MAGGEGGGGGAGGRQPGSEDGLAGSALACGSTPKLLASTPNAGPACVGAMPVAPKMARAWRAAARKPAK